MSNHDGRHVLRIVTLEFATSLTNAGLAREVAEAIAEGVAGAHVSELATKTDISELKADIYNRLWVIGAGIDRRPVEVSPG